ncbi:hypothetical protein QVD17_25791 [Tagetes erecta]|uniref:HMG box domain-containing protein n=1 Tax=Tagetes erecta TaxID=13708 RepID=A0AAD8K830_TARER|nr:hypothetical protein QVD17_25791 [Tagetes erecta]
MRGPKSNVNVAHKKLNTDTTKKTKVDKTTAKKNKASCKDPGAPKRPPTAFFVFMDEFRKDYKENFPDNKSVSVVAKQGGAKWKSMSDAEKAPYVAMAATKKAEYGNVMKQHNDLNEKEKSTSNSKTSLETTDDLDQEATS